MTGEWVLGMMVIIIIISIHQTGTKQCKVISSTTCKEVYINEGEMIKPVGIERKNDNWRQKHEHMIEKMIIERPITVVFGDSIIKHIKKYDGKHKASWDNSGIFNAGVGVRVYRVW